MTYATVSAAAAQNKKKCESQGLLQHAVEYCRNNNLNAHACCKMKEFSSLKPTTLYRYLNKEKRKDSLLKGPSSRNLNKILTDRKRKEFALFLKQCSDNNNIQNRTRMRVHIHRILQARKDLNRSLYSSLRIPLTTAETLCLAREQSVSDEWFTTFSANFP